MIHSIGCGYQSPLLILVSANTSLDENKKYIKMTKDATLEGSSQQANKDLINRRNGQGPKTSKVLLIDLFKK